MSDDIKPRLRVPANAKKGEVIEVKTLITHPMENGQRKDADGKLVPRLLVNSLQVTYNDKPLYLYVGDAYIAGLPVIGGPASINGAGAITPWGVFNTIPPSP